MTEAPAVMWFDIDGELSGVQPATVKLNPHLMFSSLRSRYLIPFTSFLTLLNRKRTPSMARIPSVISSPESISEVLITSGPTYSSS